MTFSRMRLFVYYSFIHAVFIFVVSCAGEEDISEIVDLGAVTYFPGIEEYFQSLRGDEPPDVDEPPEEPSAVWKRAAIKKKICKNIFSSHYFKMHAQEWLNVDRQHVQIELKTDYEKLFDVIFREIAPYKYEYNNAYTLQTVRISGVEEEEFGFMCPVMDRNANEIRNYFISQPYDVNMVEDDEYTSPIAGRFIFTYNDRNQLILAALAEESVFEWSMLRMSQLTPLVYTIFRVWSKFSEDPQEDIVCQLSDANKLRLCASLYAAPTFRNIVKFLPTIDNVVVQCELKVVVVDDFNWFLLTYLEHFTYPFFEFDRPNVEWVIGCKALNQNGDQITHYISRGDEANSIHVFIDGNERNVRSRYRIILNKIAPWNVFYNASVVTKAARELPSVSEFMGKIALFGLRRYFS